MFLLIFGFLVGLCVGVKRADKIRPRWPDWARWPYPIINIVKYGNGYE